MNKRVQSCLVELPVIAEIPAGDYYDEVVKPGTCVRIMTGAPVPAGADTVVKFEIVDYLENEGRAPGKVAFRAPSAVGANIRGKGEEIHAGEIAIKAGEPISAAGAGLLASCGMAYVEVYRRPRVAVIPIGSELVGPDTVPQKGEIRDGNSYAIGASVIRAGGIPVLQSIVEEEHLREISISSKKLFLKTANSLWILLTCALEKHKHLGS